MPSQHRSHWWQMHSSQTLLLSNQQHCTQLLNYVIHWYLATRKMAKISWFPTLVSSVILDWTGSRFRQFFGLWNLIMHQHTKFQQNHSPHLIKFGGRTLCLTSWKVCFSHSIVVAIASLILWHQRLHVLYVHAHYCVWHCLAYVTVNQL